MALPTRPTRTAPAPDDTTTPHGSWLMLAVLLLGQFMCIIDVLVTNVAMPSIAASLHASGASLQLVVGGYTIAYAMLLITGARLGDRYGRRLPAHHHRAARPAAGGGRPRLGLPVSRGL